MAIDEKILSIDSDDDNENYQMFSEYLEEDTKRKKKKTAIEIEVMGNQFLKEIEKKKKNKVFKSNKLISYILKYCDEKYCEEELKSYNFEDVQSIYNEIKIERRPILIKIFYFIFNI